MSDDTIVLRRAYPKLLYVALACSVLVIVLGIALAMISGGSQLTLALGVFYISFGVFVGVFGALMTAALLRFTLTLDANAITYAKVRIPWRSIGAIGRRKTFSGPYVTLTLEDGFVFRSPENSYVHSLHAISLNRMAKRYGAIMVAPVRSMDIDALQRLLEKYHMHALQSQAPTEDSDREISSPTDRPCASHDDL